MERPPKRQWPPSRTSSGGSAPSATRARSRRRWSSSRRAKLRRAEARIEAMRPYAERMRELMIGTARATPVARPPAARRARETLESVAIVPADRRPRPRGPVQRADRSGGRSQLERELRAEGTDVTLARRRQEGPLDAALPPLRDRAGLGRLHRPARLRRRAGDRAHARRALRRARGRPGRRSSTTTTSRR